MTSWHAASCKVLGMSRVIGIGPISYLGSCNFRKQCIVLWARNPSNWPPPTPPIRQTQLASFILGCILNRLRAIFRNMFSLFPLPLSLVFQSSAPRPCPLIADSDPKSPTLKLHQQILLGIYAECIILGYIHGKYIIRMTKTYICPWTTTTISIFYAWYGWPQWANLFLRRRHRVRIFCTGRHLG